MESSTKITNSTRAAKLTEEQKILRKLLVDEQETIKNLADLIERVRKIFRIESPTGRVFFQNFGDLSDPQRILTVLTGKYFAQRLSLIEDSSLGISEIARELGRPKTALSGPVKGLISEGLVEKLPVRKYRIAYNRVEDIINRILEPRKGESGTKREAPGKS